MLRPLSLLIIIGVLVAAYATLGEWSSCGATPGIGRVKRIINGHKTQNHEFPWMVSLQTEEGQHFCGGALIREDVVLTAAHCVLSRRTVTAVAGLHSLSDQGIRIKGTTVIHPSFSPMTLANDVALVRLSSPFPFGPNAQPICLLAKGEQLGIGGLVVVAGWGDESTMWDRLQPSASESYVETDGDYPTEEAKFLKKLSLRVENLTECLRQEKDYEAAMRKACLTGEVRRLWCSHMDYWLRASSRISTPKALIEPIQENLAKTQPQAMSTNLCVVRRMHHNRRGSTCYGDSGSPLMRRERDGSWTVVGIVSWGPKDCILRDESFMQLEFYTDVSLFADWIKLTSDLPPPPPPSFPPPSFPPPSPPPSPPPEYDMDETDFSDDNLEDLSLKKAH